MKYPLLRLTLLLLIVPVLSQAATAERITASEVKVLLDSGEKIVFLDTRNDYAWRSSNRLIPGAIRVHDNESFARVLNRIPPTARIVAYCT